MDQRKKTLKIGVILRYFIFVFAFVCLGFTYKAFKVSAAPAISIPTDSDFKYEEGLSFFVGYDTFTVNSVKYSFDNTNWTTIDKPESNYSAIYKNGSADNLCEKNSFISDCTSVIIEYHINSLPNSVETGVDSSTGKFTIYVEASNKRWPFGGKSDAKQTLTYDGEGPKITNVTLSSNKKVLKSGDKITFTVVFNESVRVKSSNVKISFKIGGDTLNRAASCTKNESLSGSMTCSYTVPNSVNGKISDVKIYDGGLYVVDQFGNSAGSAVASSLNDGNIVIDTTAPKVTNVIATDGIFSEGKKVYVEVTFSENLKKVSGVSSNTKLKVRFGEGTHKLCDYNTMAGTKIQYVCSISEDDQGSLNVVSIVDNHAFSDEAGNILTSSMSTFNLSGTVADNDLADLSSINLVTTSCLNKNGIQYCKKDNQIKVNFVLAGDIDSVTVNSVTFTFGGKAAKNRYSYAYDASTKTASFTYSINSEDNGTLSINYNISLKGVNGLTNVINGSKDFDVHVDNLAPSIGDVEVLLGEEKVEGTTIYANIDTAIVFNLDVIDDSVITFDSSKVYLVDENNNVIHPSIEGVKEVVVSKDGDKIIVKVVLATSVNVNVKIKIDKSALKDSLNNILVNDYYSEIYTINASLPKFDVGVTYPTYKNFTKGEKTVLISGDVINFVISSEDKDLKDFCVYENDENLCEYSELILGQLNSYKFDNSKNKEYTIYVKVRDNVLNSATKEIKFVYNNMFEYANEGIISNNHNATIDLSLLDVGDMFKYSWFKKGSAVGFGGAYTSVKTKDSNSFDVASPNNYNGDYNLCIYVENKGVTLCGDYVTFDTKIDAFSVDLESGWINESIYSNIVFNDVSAIRCIAIGKDVSSLNCENGGENIVIYRTAQLSSPFTKHEIVENGNYYFYIEDMIGNFATASKVVNNIDKEKVKIEFFKGNDNSYNTNLETNIYKDSHTILAMFDRNISGSPIELYKYFFSKNNYEINSRDYFESYYTQSAYKNNVISSAKSVNITTPDSINGIYNLYVMVVDEANNVSFANVKNIYIDSDGPNINVMNLDGTAALNVGSSEYITVFEYNIDIEETNSKLDLNNVYYKWVNDSNSKEVFVKQYVGCQFNYSICRINGSSIEMPSDIFEPNASYRFVLEVKDYAGNNSSFTSNTFKIDTTKPVITFDVEDKWYNGDVIINFNVSKNNNAGTLSEISYCVNECLSDGNFDSNKFKSLKINNYTSDNQEVYVSLNNGINTVYVYASDVFGNYKYESINIKYDSLNSEVVINNLNTNNKVDLSDSSESVIDFTINDVHSGIKKYCLYKDTESLGCHDNVNSNSFTRKLSVNLNGIYYIEVFDNAGNIYKHSVEVVGADKEPISFDLVTNVASGKLTNKDVTVSVVNMRKFLVEDVASLVKSIDYISVNESLNDYSSLFSNCISVYNNGIHSNLVTSFNVSNNGIYVVRIIDISNNVSYKEINVTSIDKVKPFVNHDLYNSSDRIYLSTVSGNNITKLVDGSYKYANESLVVKFNVDSFKDEYNGNNRAPFVVKVCFKDSDTCVYNGYNVATSINGSYVANTAIITINSPYHFSGSILYYVVDNAGNESSKYELKVQYIDKVEDVTVSIKDSQNEAIVASNKYNKVVVNFNEYNTSEITIKYSVVKSNVDLSYEFANKSTLSKFLTDYSFKDVNGNNSMNLSINNVDDSYYVWLYVSDIFGNYNLFNVKTLVRLDTIAPTFAEIGYVINRVDVTNYDIVVANDIYDMYIDLDNDGVYDKVALSDGKYSFSVNGVDSVNLKLKDSAGNESNVETIDLLSINTGTYGRVYQNGNTLQATLVIYNMEGNITSFKYIVTNVDDLKTYTASSINGEKMCVSNEMSCYKTNYSTSAKGVYNISIDQDRKLILYVYVGGNLVLDKNGELLTINLEKDDTKPVITFSENNKTLISTNNEKIYEYKLSVNEANLSKLTNIKYILSQTTYVSSFDNTYNNCVGSSSCARGLYDLDKDLNGNIIISGQDSVINRLSTGTYYLYTYVVDDHNNYSIGKSSPIYIDNSAPVISYNNSNGGYNEINSELFATKSVILRFSDDKAVSYFNVYNNEGTLLATCNVLDSSLNVNCNGDSYNDMGSYVLYNLDTGSYKVVAYDTSDNSKEVVIGIDMAAPVIEIYKKMGESYVAQPGGDKVYNSLENLYLKVVEDNFSYIVIDLYNTITGSVVNSAVRYSYNSEVGKCLITCEYGKELKEILVTNTEYNKIVIRAYDKSDRYGELIINYDDVTPTIWVKDIGESIKLDGVFYEILENYTFNFEIGVNNKVTLDRALNAFVISVDSMSYSDAKNNGLLSVVTYKKVSSSYSVFEGDVFDYIGEYKVEIRYTDDAGNAAETKVVYINVIDNTDPVVNFSGVNGVVELNEEVRIPLLKVSDNYGLDSDKTKEMYLGLENGTCMINGSSCVGSFVGVNGSYKFNKVGVYEFTYSITDISSNTTTFNFSIEVKDTKGPTMMSTDSIRRVLRVGERIGSTVNVSTVAVSYPTSYDVGDGTNKNVTYLGIYALNANNEKYKVDKYVVSNESGVITCLFNNIGTFYIRFMSSDINGNVSTFEYEVIVIDEVKPVINGVKNNETIELDLDLQYSFDVSTIVALKNIRVSDNYDDNLKLNYLQNGNSITFSATDSSGNTTNVTVHVELIDNEAPVVGELVVDAITNLNELYFEIKGGSDNSNDWRHEYSIDNINWQKYMPNESKLVFGSEVNTTVRLCIRAADKKNYSNIICQNIIVDTKAPVVSGIENGEIVKEEVTIQVNDNNLSSIAMYKDNKLMNVSISNLPVTVKEEGTYYIEAVDTLGNVRKVSFVIDISTHMEVVNDVSAKEYTTTVVEFDKRLIAKVDVEYDTSGNAKMSVNLENVNVASNSMLYILGVVPRTDASFVIYSLNGDKVNEYSNIVLVDGDSRFIENHDNEDCFIKIGDDYYAYLVVRQVDSNTQTTETNEFMGNNDDSGLLKTIMIILGSIATLIVGYQIFRLKRRVRAA